MEQVNTSDLVSFGGIIDSVRWTGDRGFSILSVHPMDVNIGMKLVTVAGTLFEPRKNDKVKVEGEWNTHPRFGLQIKASNIQVVLPETKDGIYKLLKSKNFLPGIGKQTAKLLSDKFGKTIFDVLEKSPEDLLSVKGISQNKLDKILTEYNKKSRRRDILQFCATYGIPQGQGEKISEVYGSSAVTILKRNPYLLTETNKGIRGIGFKKADAIAISQNLPRDSEDRITHGLLYTLNELTAKKGGTASGKDSLIKESAKMMSLSENIVGPYLNKMVQSDNPQLIEDEMDDKLCIWTTVMYSKEKKIARMILDIRDRVQKARIPINIDREIEQAEIANKIKLEVSQKSAIKNTLKSTFSVITGGPGVGKTTITRCLINILKKAGNRVQCAAPTGRAAKRMKEATGHLSRTIHRLLEYGEEDGRLKFKRNLENPLDGDVFIIDESSMVDTFIMSALLEAIPKGGMVVFIGDVDQLPSVGPGKILEDIIRSRAVQVSRLKTIFRQAAESKIITAAHDINSGSMPETTNDPSDDFFFMDAENNASCASKILSLVKYIPKRFGCDPLWDVQVLSPKKASEVGTERLNVILQEYFIPDTRTVRGRMKAIEKKKQGYPLTEDDSQFLAMSVHTPIIEGKFGLYALGDKVMQTSNNYDKGVFNGDIGQIVAVDVRASKKFDEPCVSIRFPDDSGGFKDISYVKAELTEQVVLSYACTIHKSQGSEYPYVIIPIMPTFSIMLQRKLIYTGVTRGKKLVTLVGSKDSLHNAVTNHFRMAVGSRHTKLKFWLSHPEEVYQV